MEGESKIKVIKDYFGDVRPVTYTELRELKTGEIEEIYNGIKALKA